MSLGTFVMDNFVWLVFIMFVIVVAVINVEVYLHYCYCRDRPRKLLNCNLSRRIFCQQMMNLIMSMMIKPQLRAQ
ncbi:Hypothetical predicted protein [Cloeon dipterum]|uniref:Uncharacterized protein n=1 Tax=Cloeon dipterum TaxID=197152 RepID=A0A8S1DTI4_9INSE|nr:Hypothetical predicted protein [Cloeon dipterum]